MNLGSVNRTLSLARDIFDSAEKAKTAVEFSLKKPRLKYSPPALPLPRTSPESEGVDSSYIADFLSELKSDRRLNMHNVMIIRNGKIIAETSFGSQNMMRQKMTFSACKSIVSLAIGMMIDDGLLSLSDKICDIFPDEAGAINRIKLRDLTIEHLLTMSSGIVFNEAEAMTEENWLRAYFNSATRFAPGKDFSYNSLNTYMLSAVICKKSGSSLVDYLTPRLFEPLGIRDIFWAQCPKGIEIGGWGLYIRPEDLAKIGILVLDGGMWCGKRLISEEYLAAATAAHMEVPLSAGDFNYGYQIWVQRDGRSFLFNGMLGQNLLAFPRSKVILVSNAGNDELFQQDDYFKIALKYFASYEPTKPLTPSRAASRKLIAASTDASEIRSDLLSLPGAYLNRAILPIFRKTSEEAAWAALDGKIFEATSSDSSMRLLPIALQVIESVYTSHFKSIEFCSDKSGRYFIYREENAEYKLPLDGCSEICVGESVYAVSTEFRVAENEDGALAVKIKVDFLETPFSRIIKIMPDGEYSTIAQKELPGEQLLRNGINGLFTSLGEKPIISGIIEKLDEDYINYRLERLFSPKISATEKRAKGGI